MSGPLSGLGPLEYWPSAYLILFIVLVVFPLIYLTGNGLCCALRLLFRPLLRTLTALNSVLVKDDADF